MKKTIHISGMHCISCEVLLEKELKQIPDLKNYQVSHKKGTLELEGENISIEKIKDIIKKYGYKIVDKEARHTSKSKISLNDIIQIIVIFGILVLVVFLINILEITRLFPDIDKNVSLVVALLFGVIASVSTCLALTGGIVMSFASEYKVQEKGFFHRVLPQIYFHIGRIGGFAVLGGLLGLLGKSIGYSTSFAGYFTIVVAMVMLYTGLQILNLTPNITRLGFHLPKKLSTGIHNLQKKEHPFVPAMIGALTFLLPCGFTQAMQLAAVASGSFLSGALIMALFAFGTLPVLFSVGVGSSYAQNNKFGLFKKIIGMVIVFFAFYSFNSGLVLAGFASPLGYFKSTKSAEIAEVKDDVQVVKMDVDYTFKPTEFEIKKDIPVRWEINGINITGCSNEVVIPKLNISSGKLKEGLNIMEFTPIETGILPFSCWMGMISGKFIVVDVEYNKSVRKN